MPLYRKAISLLSELQLPPSIVENSLSSSLIFTDIHVVDMDVHKASAGEGFAGSAVTVTCFDVTYQCLCMLGLPPLQYLS